MNLFTYEKGYCFVYYLSQLCGGPQRFDDFLRVSISGPPPRVQNFFQLAELSFPEEKGTWEPDLGHGLWRYCPLLLLTLSVGPMGHLDWDARL